MELLILLAALVALTWLAIYAKHGSLLISLALFLIVGSVFGHAYFNTNVGPLPVTLDRLLWCGLLIQFVFFQRMRMNDSKPIGRIDIVFGLYILYIGANTLMNDWQYNGKAPLGQWLFYYVMPATAYWMARQAKVGEREFRWFTAVMSALGLYLAITAIAETREWWFMVFPGHIADITKTEFLGRGRGPFLNPVSCGIFQTFGLCCMLMWWPRVSHRGKTIIVCLSMVFCIGILMTLTRSLWVSLAVSLGGIIWLATTNRTRGLLIAGGTTLAVMGLLVLGDDLASFKRDKYVSETQMAESAKLRPMLAAVAIEMAKDKPVTGFGLGQYSPASQPYHFTDEYEMPLRRVSVFVQHNAFLSSLAETGLVGLLMLVFLLAAWTRSAWRLWNSACPLFARQIGLLQIVIVVMFAINGMFHDTLIVPMGTTLLFFFAGLNVGVARKFFVPVAVETAETADLSSEANPVPAPLG